jgi:hypothetical protein
MDFREFRHGEKIAWHKEASNAICVIRNHEDRVLFLEKHTFQDDFCRECRIFSSHGHFLSIHKMFYQFFGDPFDGVILYDANDHAVMWKKYAFDPEERIYTQLIEEQWDMEKPLPTYA